MSLLPHLYQYGFMDILAYGLEFNIIIYFIAQTDLGLVFRSSIRLSPVLSTCLILLHAFPCLLALKDVLGSSCIFHATVVELTTSSKEPWFLLLDNSI